MGKIEIDHTGSGGGVTLSSDGTDLLLDGTAVGGLPELYAENPSSPTAPSATGTNAVAIGSGASASGELAIAMTRNAVSSGYASFAAGNVATATGGSSVAIGGLSDATADGSTAIGFVAQATAYRSTAVGYGANAVTNARSTALTNSYASGTDSFAAAIANNTSSYGATGANSVAIGNSAKAEGSQSFAVSGGRAEGDYSFALGDGSWARYNDSIALQRGAFVNAEKGIAIGSRAVVTVKTKIARGTAAFAPAYNSGEAQSGDLVLVSDTTDATPEVLTVDNLTPTAFNQIILPNNSAYAFHGTIVAREQASSGTDCAAWRIEGLIRREGSAGTTTLVNSATTVIDNTPAWGLALSADTTNGGLAITVTGAAATNIRWVATVHTSEVTY